MLSVTYFVAPTLYIILHHFYIIFTSFLHHKEKSYDKNQNTFAFGGGCGGARRDVGAEVGTTPVAPQPFKSGSVVSNVKAVLDFEFKNDKSFKLTWSEVPAARYIVYSIARDNETGVFGEWKVEVVDLAKLDLNVDAGKTAYVTVLPFTDTPTRQYGGFSAYKLVKA